MPWNFALLALGPEAAADVPLVMEPSTAVSADASCTVGVPRRRSSARVATRCCASWQRWAKHWRLSRRKLCWSASTGRRGKLHRRLPLWLEWAVVVPLAPVGPFAYLVWGGDQWWNWGQLSPIPLLLLAMRDELRGAFRDDDEHDAPGQPVYGGFADGPWGPPGA